MAMAASVMVYWNELAVVLQECTRVAEKRFLFLEQKIEVEVPTLRHRALLTHNPQKN